MQFLFLDLRKGEDHPIQPPHLAARAKRIHPDQAAASVQELLANEEQPVVLICDDGTISTETGESLALRGYRNVFIVEGGARQLLREWEHSKHG